MSGENLRILSWRPIGEAPKGVLVLLVDEDGVLHTGTQVRPDKWRDPNECVVWRPTHWMPLPAPPMTAPRADCEKGDDRD